MSANMVCSQKSKGKIEKRYFLGFVFGALTLITGLFVCVLSLLFTFGFFDIHFMMPFVIGILCIILLSPLFWLVLELALQTYIGRTFLDPLKVRDCTIRFLFPVVEVIARLIRMPMNSVRRSFITINNELIVSSKGSYTSHDILVLVAHCTQASRCKYRLTYDNDNCIRCGKCPIGPLLMLRDALGIQLVTATGGTMARRLVAQSKPRMIVAVACERDLVSGIQDIPSFPVFGFLNECPHGPCVDTFVDVKKLKNVLELFIPNTDCLIGSVVTKEESHLLDQWTGPLDYKNLVPHKNEVIQ